jgi:hypothetical protein
VNKQEMSSALRCLLVLAAISAILYLFNRFLLIPLFPDVVFLRSYIGDILALPVYLPLSFYLSYKLDLVVPSFRLNHLHILGAVLLFSLIFEGILPMIDESTTGDPLDILAYSLGGLLVYVINTCGIQQVVNEL